MELTSIGKYRQILASDVLKLPGLNLLGHNVSSKASFPMGQHVHGGAMEFVVVAKGNESYFVDGGVYELAGGDVFLSGVNEPHSNGNAPQGVSEIFWFQIDPSAEGLLGLSAQRADCLRDRLLSINAHRIKTDREGLALMRKCFSGFLKQDGDSWNISASLFVSFLCRLLFLQRQQAADDALVTLALRTIHENIHAPITMESLSALCGVSLSSFKHRFKECTGETPRDYINQCKIARARELLKAGKTVTETAMELGFNSSDYFAVVFKKYTAQTPSQYASSGSKP